MQAGDAAVVFAVFLGMGGAQVVVSGAGVGVDVVVRLGFFVVIGEGAGEQVVFEQVGVVAGVVGVAVAEHGSDVWRAVRCWSMNVKMVRRGAPCEVLLRGQLVPIRPLW